MSARIWALCCVFGLAGCGDANAIVDLTLALDPRVPDALAARARTLELDFGGADSTTVDDPLAQPFADARQERVVIRVAASGALTITATVRDAAGALILAGSADVTLQPGATAAAELALLPPPASPDGGAPDLAPFDQLNSNDSNPAADMAAIVCPLNVLLCDGFESGTVDATRWDATGAPTSGALSVDNQHAHRGQYALHLHTNAIAAGGTTAVTVGETHTFGGAAATFYVRAWYYFPSNTQTAVATLLDASQNAGVDNDVSLAIDHDALSTYNGFNGGSYVASTTPKIPLDQWTCLEWEVDPNVPNQLHAWVDGQPVPALDLMQPTTGAPPIGLLELGLAIYPPNAATSALDVWLDDVIVDGAPIGCAR